MSETVETQQENAQETPKKKAGRPRKHTPPTRETQAYTMNNENGEENTDQKDISKLEKDVDRLIRLVKGFTPTFNRKQRLSVVNLNSKNTGQGITFRQLFVEESPGFIEVSLCEGFKSSHGGSDQRKTLHMFRIPISEFDLYSRVQQRFFGYNPRKNSNEATLLLDTLEQTVTT